MGKRRPGLMCTVLFERPGGHRKRKERNMVKWIKAKAQAVKKFVRKILYTFWEWVEDCGEKIAQWGFEQAEKYK